MDKYDVCQCRLPELSEASSKRQTYVAVGTPFSFTVTMTDIAGNITTPVKLQSFDVD